LGISLGAGIGAGIAVLLLVLYCKWRCPHDKRQQIAEIRLNKYLQTFLMEVKHNKDAFHDLCSELSDLGLIQEQAVSLPVSSTVVDIPEDADVRMLHMRGTIREGREPSGMRSEMRARIRTIVH